MMRIMARRTKAAAVTSPAFILMKAARVARGSIRASCSTFSTLEEQIPADHLLRRLNPVVTRVLVDLREKLAPFHSDIGRPSIDPELMIRMLLVGYCYGNREDFPKSRSTNPAAYVGLGSHSRPTGSGQQTDPLPE
jgi:hypothetical protein